MDWFEFISAMTESLIWPVVTIIIVFSLRQPVTELIPLLKKLKYKELELEFSKLKDDAKIATYDKNGGSASSDNEESFLPLQLVPFSQRAAIMEAWREVETAAISAAGSFLKSSSNDSLRNIKKLGQDLVQGQIIDENELHIFNKLRDLRNKSAHAEHLNLNESDAKFYIELASNLIKRIKSSKPANE